MDASTIQSSQLPQKQLTELQEKSLEKLYDLSRTVLKKNAALGKPGIFNDTHTKELLVVLHKTNNLKKKGLTIKQAGIFVYQREQKLTEGIGLNQSHASPYHVAVLFDLLNHYIPTIEKNEFTIPTLEQYQQYIFNQNKQKEYITAITEAATFGISLTIKMIKKDKPPFIDVPMNCATEELNKLIKNIQSMCSKKITVIKALAELLYLNNANNDDAA